MELAAAPSFEKMLTQFFRPNTDSDLSISGKVSCEGLLNVAIRNGIANTVADIKTPRLIQFNFSYSRFDA